MNKSSRIIYLDTLRIIATIAVILTHVSTMHIEDLSCHTIDWQIHNIYASFSRWCVPMFLMISGALFLNHEKPVNIQKLYKKNILRIVTALIVWSFLYAIFQYLTIERYHNLSSIIGLTIIGHYHLWFLYLIIGIYIALPVLKKISENKTVLQYFLIISFVFTFILPLIIEIGKSNLPQQIWDSFDSHPYFLKALEGNFNLLNPTIAIGFVFYFMLGHYIDIKDIKSRHVILITIGGLIGFLCIIMGTYYSTSLQNSFSGDFYHYLNICPLFEAIAVFCFIKYISHSRHHTKRIIDTLSKTSFGTYLIHLMLMETCISYGIDTLIINPILSIPLIVFLLYTISTLIIFVLIQIPWINRYCL